MSSGFPGGDLYGAGGYPGIAAAASAVNSAVPVQYRPQLGSIFVDSAPAPPSPHHLLPSKRPVGDLERLHPQQQQNLLLLRSVKQRTHLSSPISPLSPIDLSSASSSSPSSARLGGGSVVPLLPQKQQQHRPQIGNFAFPAANRAAAVGSEPETEKKMRSCLQELEKELLGDDGDDDDDESASAVSVVTSGGWGEAMQSLIVPKPLPTSPTSSTSSCTTTSSSPSPAPAASPTSPTSSKQLLMDSAAAIADGRTDAAAVALARLKQVVNPRAADPEQRLAAHMVATLISRINPPESGGGGVSIAELCSGEHAIASQMLYEASPCFKLGFMAANMAILEATRDQLKIHIVDFDIGHGSQYVTLFQALAERQSPKPSLKITAVTDPNSVGPASGGVGLPAVRDRLTKLADSVGVGLSFGVTCRWPAELRRESIGCGEDEALAVNFAFRLYRMADESVSTENPRDELLRVVRSLGPAVVTVVEQEMNANTAPFLARFGEAWAYYRAMFESLDATMPRDAPHRARVEDCLARKAANAVAREGRDRLERPEVLGKWRARMGMAGFKPLPLAPHIADSMRARALCTHPSFFVRDDSGAVCFGWMGRTLTVASAWR